ncbi:zinc-dependent alcohol dehydrogenase [Kineococcus sp. SYSU DK003]|uniref:zinc-dependent alcohol dehydrogenase n=1 Tax=Kineococcus sp. SYSU DK003 TaxID=3383124 RepID=UPI003D7C5433
MITAARIVAPQQISLTEQDDHRPAPDGVVVDVASCGICATDVHAWVAGPGPLPSAVFGHEWTGTVSAVGGEVEGVRVGQRVAAAVGLPCGRCAQCRAGFADHCDLVFAEANGVGPQAGTHGGFATQLRVPARRVLAIPDDLPDEAAALLEPTAVTFHAVRRTAPAPGAVVVVQGAGPIGLLTAAHARATGAGRVLLADPVAARRDLARAVGFADVADPAGLPELVEQASGGLGADVLFECTGVADLLHPSTTLVRRGGTLSLLGYTSRPSQVVYGEWQFRELRVVSSLVYGHADVLGALQALRSGVVRADLLHTGTVSLTDLQETLEVLRAGGSGHVKVLVDPRR